jgi:galactoside O-acetyltransferase
MTPDASRFALRSCGEDVTIYDWVRIIRAEHVSIGSHVIVDDFVFLDGGRGLSIGSHVHIASFCSLIGGGEITLGDFSGIAAGARIVSGTDLADGSGLIGPTIPGELRAVKRSFVNIGRHAFVGTNVVVHPGVTIGEGAVIGSNSLVTRDVAPWTVSIGTPARPIRDRRPDRILALEAQLLERERGGD